MKILIVDDSRAMRMIVRRTLRQAGFEFTQVTEVGSGADALAAVADSTPNLILSDWNMPEMTGIELLTALKANGCPSTFGFVTSESTDEMRDQALKAGAIFLITKPFTPESFERVLAPVIRNA
jgi:two-component system, chemotaxis family, chemotaxis protein CheY